MKNHTDQYPKYPHRVENSLATDSGVLSQKDVENALAYFPEPDPELTRVFYGIRNSLIFSGLLWALIVLLFYIF